MSTAWRRRLVVGAAAAVAAIAIAGVGGAWVRARVGGAAGSQESLLEPLRPMRFLPIVRDEAALEEISRTAGVALPRHAQEPLRLVVEKSRRLLRVVAAEDGRAIKAYPVALGGSPEGAKEREGDQRTPEGRYVLQPRHESPSFGTCFFVCYPNAKDAERGREAGLISDRQAAAIRAAEGDRRSPPQDTPLGGLILVHGTSNRSQGALTRLDWTLGCIALENPDLLELLAAFEPADRPEIEIRP